MKTPDFKLAKFSGCIVVGGWGGIVVNLEPRFFAIVALVSLLLIVLYAKYRKDWGQLGWYVALFALGAIATGIEPWFWEWINVAI